MPLGLEDKRVHNKMMRASSYYNYWCGPWSGRLNGRRHGRYGGAWCSKRRDRHQWLQIDFGALTKVYRIASQGRQNSAQWVTSYSLSYSKNGYKFITYKEGGRTKVSSETGAIKGDVAALVRSHTNGLQPFESTIEQKTEKMPPPPNHKTITAAAVTTNTITSLRELLHYRQSCFFVTHWTTESREGTPCMKLSKTSIFIGSCQHEALLF